MMQMTNQDEEKVVDFTKYDMTINGCLCFPSLRLSLGE